MKYVVSITNMGKLTHTHTYTKRSCSSLTPESSTEDLRVESLLVFADFRSVTNWTSVGGIDIDHGAFPHLQLQLLKARAQTYNTHKQHKLRNTALSD